MGSQRAHSGSQKKGPVERHRSGGGVKGGGRTDADLRGLGWGSELPPPPPPPGGKWGPVAQRQERWRRRAQSLPQAVVQNFSIFWRAWGGCRGKWDLSRVPLSCHTVRDGLGQPGSPRALPPPSKPPPEATGVSGLGLQEPEMPPKHKEVCRTRSTYSERWLWTWKRIGPQGEGPGFALAPPAPGRGPGLWRASGFPGRPAPSPSSCLTVSCSSSLSSQVW